MPYTILKSKYKFLNLLLNSKKQQDNIDEYIIISDEKFNEFKTVDTALNCEYQEPQYYWYVSQVDPRTVSEADAVIVTDTQSQGWRLVENPDVYVFDAIASDKAIWSNPQSTATWYMALPANETITAYDGFNIKIDINTWNEYMFQLTFKGINYNVFILEESPSWGGYKIQK